MMERSTRVVVVVVVVYMRIERSSVLKRLCARLCGAAL